MAVIDGGFGNKERVQRWAREIWEAHQRKPFFDKFIPTERERLPWYTVFKNRFTSKLDDIAWAFRIVFKGEYPDDDYD